MKVRDVRLRWAGASELAVACLLLGSMPLLVAPSYSVGLMVMLVVDLVALLAWLADVRAARRGLGRLDLAWRVPADLGVGRTSCLDLEIFNPDPEPVQLEVQPRWPVEMAQELSPVELRVPGRGRSEAQVKVLPMQSGEHRHRTLELRAHGPLGLAYVDAEVPAPGVATVGPEVLPLIRRRRSRIRRVTEEGNRTLTRVSPDGERAEARPFEPGDPLRAVDWKSTARRRKLVVRECQPEVRRRILIGLECGRGMAREMEGRPALTLAVAGVLGLARHLVDEGASVEVVVFDDQLRLASKELRNRKSVAGLGASLAELRASATEPDHGLLDARLARARRGLERVVLVSAQEASNLQSSLLPHLDAWTRRQPLSLIQLRPPELWSRAQLLACGEEGIYRAAVRNLSRTQEVFLEGKLRAAGCLRLAAGPEELPRALEAAVKAGPRPGRRSRRRGRARS